MKFLLKSTKPFFKLELSRDTFSLVSNSLFSVISKDCIVKEQDLDLLLELYKVGLLPSFSYFVIKKDALLIFDLNEGKLKPSFRPLNRFFCELEIEKETKKVSSKKPVIPVVAPPTINPDGESNDNEEQDSDHKEPVTEQDFDDKPSKKGDFKIKKKG